MRLKYLAALAVALLTAFPGYAEQKIGSVTQQPLPRWVSMKAPEANARRGPSINHRIDWVFRHRHMPLLVTAEHGHWRRVVDRDGAGGWVHYVLLSRARTVIIDQDMAELHRQPDPESDVVARTEQGVIAYLKECTGGWCRISIEGYKGWVPETVLWGVGTPGLSDDDVAAVAPAPVSDAGTN